MKTTKIISICLLLLPGCAVQKSSRPTFAVCMTGPRVWTLGLEYWPVFENGCRDLNLNADHDIDLEDFSAHQNNYKPGGSGDEND